MIAVINYINENIEDLTKPLDKLGKDYKVTSAESDVLRSDKVIFPGVGEASNAMNKLKESKLDTLIPTLKQPVLGICLGMQLMCNSTEEGNTKGLGIFNTEVKRFSNQVKVPHMGWNTITNLKSNLFKGINNNAFMYLVHSYYAELCPQTIATTFYDIEYASAIENENFYGVQFHPEKSSEAGEQLLKNFLEL